MHYVATSLRCPCTQGSLLYLPSELRDCTSVVPWLLQPLFLQCSPAVRDLGMCWAPVLREQCCKPLVDVLPFTPSWEGSVCLSATPRSNLTLFCLSMIMNVHDSVLGLLLCMAICGLTPSGWNWPVCQWEARITKHFQSSHLSTKVYRI